MKLTKMFGKGSGFCGGNTLMVTVFAVCLVGSMAAYGQAAKPDSGILHLTSRLVALDVTVLDKNDHLVSDLRREDFKVYENGVQQQIQSFESFSEHLLPATFTSSSIQNTRDLQRLVPNAPVTVLVLDEVNTQFSDNAFARVAIRKYLMAQPEVLTQPTSFLAATDAGFQQVVDYTLDKTRLLNGLAHLPAVLPAGLMRTAGTPEGQAIRFAQTLASLEQVASATVGHSGRKNIIWVGRGFESLDLRNEPDHQVKIVKAAAERTVNALRDAHATVYSIDPTLSTKLGTDDSVETAITDSNAFSSETHNATDPFDGTISFNTLAPESGGRAFAVMNDIDAEIATSVKEGSSYYSVSYVPSESIDAAHPYRGIDVRVSRPGLRVVSRRGYYSSTPPMPLRNAAQQHKAEGFDLGNAISSGLTYTGLSLTAGLSRKDSAICIVQVQMKDIQWQADADGNTRAHLTVVAVAFDGKSRPIGKAVKDVVAKLGPDRQLADIPFLTVQIPLPTVPGALVDRIAVRDETSGKIGTAEVQPAAR